MSPADAIGGAPTEVELKYVVTDREAVDALLSGPAIGPFAIEPLAPIETEDRYLDTPSGSFDRVMLALRLRKTGSRTIVGLKSTTAFAGATHRRQELEADATPSLDPADWPASEARRVVEEVAGGEPLDERVSIRQVRQRRDLVADGTRVELSLDDVVVFHGAIVVDRFTELEAELRSGDEHRLAELAEALEASGALRSSGASKLARALRAVEQAREEVDPVEATTAEGAPREATPLEATAPGATLAGGAPLEAAALPKHPGVRADDTVAEAGRKVLRLHLARMIAREAGARDGSDPEELHGMRVATRRMRAAWRVFADGFRPERTRRIRVRLRLVAGRLGAVRDRDVLIDAVERYQASLPEAERAGMEPLLEAWRTEREEARELLLRELDSAGYRRWLDAYRELVAVEGAATAPTTATTPHRVRDTGASRLWAAYEQVRAYEAVLRWADVTTLHELRIAAKRLRYTLEFLRETLPSESAALIARIVVLQDHLGYLNDAHVAALLTRSFLLRHAGELDDLETSVIGRYLASREQEVIRLRRSVGAPWRGVAGLAFRRALGRVTAGL